MDGSAERRWRRTSATSRLAIAAALGVIAGGIVLGITRQPKATGLTVWISAAATFLLLTLAATWWLDGRQTQDLVRREDAARPVRIAELVVVAIATVLVVALVIFQSKSNERHYLILGVVAIALSWMVVHTIFTLRYARLYYAEPVGGIHFRDHENLDTGELLQPAYRDFYYVGFTVGMTFQVADTDVGKKSIRMSILGHALISFVFGTMIIAVTINILAGLGGK